MAKLSLFFSGEKSPELVETAFSHPILTSDKRCVRGKSPGAYEGYSTFQWSKAVQGLSLLILRAKIEQSLDPNSTGMMRPHIVGYALSQAASLDYALDKQTPWLLDMLGWDRNGLALARRAITRTNPGRKREGPVALSLNTNFLSISDIKIHLDGREVTEVSRIVYLAQRISTLCEGVKAVEAPPVELKLAS